MFTTVNQVVIHQVGDHGVINTGPDTDLSCSRCWRCSALCAFAMVWQFATIRTSSVTACCQVETFYFKRASLIELQGMRTSYFFVS